MRITGRKSGCCQVRMPSLARPRPPWKARTLSHHFVVVVFSDRISIGPISRSVHGSADVQALLQLDSLLLPASSLLGAARASLCPCYAFFLPGCVRPSPTPFDQGAVHPMPPEAPVGGRVRALCGDTCGDMLSRFRALFVRIVTLRRRACRLCSFNVLPVVIC